MNPTNHCTEIIFPFPGLGLEAVPFFISKVEPVPFSSSTAYFVIAWAALRFIEPLLDNYKGRIKNK